MTAKRVIQSYKTPPHWRQSPPGVGDFVRGACHLFERMQPRGIEVRFDVSTTEFAAVIEQDPDAFHTGEPSRVADAVEYFEEHEHPSLYARLDAFAQSDETELYVCTNIGAWNRTALPPEARRFGAAFYRFTEPVEAAKAAAIRVPAYEVLSVRCGDEFYGDAEAMPSPEARQVIVRTIENYVLPQAAAPIVITSDCYRLKLELAERYGLLVLPLRSQHGAFGGAMAVATDLCLLRDARFTYHINTWADWWSGFSHYTALIFQIPGMNFRAPRYWKEEVTASGKLVRERWWHALARG